MGHIKEHKGVNVFIPQSTLTKNEAKEVAEFIKNYKKKKQKTGTKKKKNSDGTHKST